MKKIPSQLNCVLKQRYLDEAMSLASPTTYTPSKKNEEKKKPTSQTVPPFVSYDERIDLSKVLPDFSRPGWTPPAPPAPSTPGPGQAGYEIRNDPNFSSRASRIGSKVGEVLSHPRVQFPASLASHMIAGYYPAKWTSQLVSPYLEAPEYTARYPALVAGEIAGSAAIGAAKQALQPETWATLRSAFKESPFSPKTYTSGAGGAAREMLFKGAPKGVLRGIKNLQNPYVWAATAIVPEIVGYIGSGKANVDFETAMKMAGAVTAPEYAMNDAVGTLMGTNVSDPDRAKQLLYTGEELKRMYAEQEAKRKALESAQSQGFEKEMEKVEGTYDERREKERERQKREFDRMSPQQRKDYEEALKGQKTKRTSLTPLGDFVTQGTYRDEYPEVDYKLENLLTDVGQFALDPFTPTAALLQQGLEAKANREVGDATKAGSPSKVRFTGPKF